MRSGHRPPSQHLSFLSDDVMREREWMKNVRMMGMM